MNQSEYIELFNRLYADHKERFVRFTLSYIKDEEEAEDIVSDAFIYYWENRESLKDNSNLPAYILTVIKHKCLNYLEHQRVRLKAEGVIKENMDRELQTSILSLEACEPNALYAKEISEISKKTLKSMPEKSRRIFMLSRIENKSNKEIAAIMGMSEKSVEYHITKALSIFRKKLWDYL